MTVLLIDVFLCDQFTFTPLVQKMAYSSQAFVIAENLVKGPIPPPNLGLFSSAFISWFLMFGRLIGSYDSHTIFNLIFRAVSKLRRLLHSANDTVPTTITLLSDSSLHLFILQLHLIVLGLLDRYALQKIEAMEAAAPRNFSRSFFWLTRRFWWAMFWGWYFTSSKGSDFHQDFLEAWKKWLQGKLQPDLPPWQPQQEPWSLLVFLDNESMMEVPCFDNTDDKDFFAYLQGLHELVRVEKQTLFKFSLQVLGRVDIAKVCFFPFGRSSPLKCSKTSFLSN